MKIKEFLKNIQKKKNAITLIEEQIDTLKLMAEYKGVAIDPNQPSRGTDNPHRTEDYICRAVDLSNKLNQIKIEYLVDVEKATGMILNLNDDKTLQIFWRRYIKFMKWETIASELGITYQWTLELHGRGLEELNKKYPDFS